MNLEILLQKDEQHFDSMASIMCSTDPWITLKRTHNDCLQSLRGVGKEVYTIFLDNEVVGVVVLQTLGSFRIYLQSICIAEKARSKGLGNKVLDFFEERIFSESPNFFLCVSKFNQRAQKLYYSRGFKLIGEIEDFVIEGQSELLLRKSIGSFSSFKPKK